jgi:predicted ATPase
VEEGSQFLIATHSPILLTFPDARIYRLSEEGIASITYEESDAYQLTKAFLDGPERFLRHLFAED